MKQKTSEPLELRELNIYLPFGIKCLVTKKSYSHLSEEERIGELTQIETDSNVQNIVVTKDNGEYLLTEIDSIKPILFPMTSFYSEILHEGKTINPNKWILEDSWMYRQTPEDLECLFNKTERTTELPFWIVERLITLHFDVFGLIKDGYALDINNITNIA